MLKGTFIGVAENADTFVVEKVFTAARGRAVLRATALGVYFAEINGVRVGDACMAPGWTSYGKLLQVQTYDVSGLVRDGENTLAFTVNAGWYRGALTWDRKENYYGPQSAVCAELTAGGVTVCTDETWRARESFIRQSGIYDGETQDFTAERAPLTVCTVPFDKSVLAAQISEPVRTTARLRPQCLFRTPAGETVYDFGQNLVGVAEIVTPEAFDGTITLQFAEILVDGNFYTDNLRTAKATDRFTVRGAHTLAPEFTFHGFRYMKMEGAELPVTAVTALVRHTDMRRTGRIETSDARFNRLMENVVWGQRGNFFDIPTDCPQRDERLGWTGDANAFCRTAAYNYDVRGIFRKWLFNARLDQAPTGEMPTVIPDVLREHATDAQWGDAITMIPWTLYEMYGDKSFLSDNYAAMRAYRAAVERTLENGLIVRGHQFGDWLALDREPLTNATLTGRTDVHFIADAYYAASLKIAADTAAVLGDRPSADTYRRKRRALIGRIRAEYFTRTGRLAVDTVTAETLALYFDLVPPKHRARLAADLHANVVRHGYLVATGFIGTRFLLFALTDNGYAETARRVLFNRGCPGWLYEVDMGATTIWERWDSMQPDGSPNPDGMNSYNHYAYGAVQEYVYRRIAGIEPLSPGFARVKIAPAPTAGLTRVRVEFDSVRGTIAAGYEQKNAGTIVFFARIPDGVRAEVRLPGEKSILVGGGEYVFERPWEDLVRPAFAPDNTVGEVFRNPKAHEAFAKAFGTLLDLQGVGWLRNEHAPLRELAALLEKEANVSEEEFAARLARANEWYDSTSPPAVSV